jgi:hypothetical protein
LWAEAVARFESGERWHVDTEGFRALCEAEQAERVLDDPWAALKGHLAGKSRQPARASRRLSAQASMRAAVVVADVFAQNALGVALAEEQDVIEAVAPERHNQALANRVRLRRSWRRAEAPHPKTAEPRAEARRTGGPKASGPRRS